MCEYTSAPCVVHEHAHVCTRKEDTGSQRGAYCIANMTPFTAHVQRGPTTTTTTTNNNNNTNKNYIIIIITTTTTNNMNNVKACPGP